MKNSLLFVIRASALALSLGSAAAATLNLGGLDWQTFGDVAAQGGGAIITTAYSDGLDDSEQHNVSGVNPLLAGGPLETAFVVANGSLDVDNILQQASEGSGLSRFFTVQAGDVLTFDWQLLTSDTTGADYAFLIIGSTRYDLGDVSEATEVGTAPFLGQTIENTYQYTFATAGTYNVAFGVVDIGDAAASSGLSVGNITVGAVPEPSHAVLAFFGIAAAFFRRRRNA